MIPTSLLPNLSLPAAKLYLVFLSLPSTGPTIQIPITTLAQLSSLAPRTCQTALKELRDLNLLRSLPGRFHSPNTYTLLTITPTGAQPRRLTPPKGRR